MIATLVSAALVSLVARCAPDVGPVTMSAIVVYESDGRPYAIGDNTTRRSYFPVDRASATHLAARLIGAGHDIDIGYAQINITNVRAYGLDVASAFDPCTNIATGARILRSDYAGAARTFGPGQRALASALSAYDTGGYFAGLGYARAVYAMAATLRFDARPTFVMARRSQITQTRHIEHAARAVRFVPASDVAQGAR